MSENRHLSFLRFKLRAFEELVTRSYARGDHKAEEWYGKKVTDLRKTIEKMETEIERSAAPKK